MIQGALQNQTLRYVTTMRMQCKSMLLPLPLLPLLPLPLLLLLLPYPSPFSSSSSPLPLLPLLQMGMVVAGFIKKSMSYGCFVELPHHLSGLAPSKYLADEFVSDGAGLYRDMQSVYAKVRTLQVTMLTCVHAEFSSQKSSARIWRKLTYMYHPPPPPPPILQKPTRVKTGAVLVNSYRAFTIYQAPFFTFHGPRKSLNSNVALTFTFSWALAFAFARALTVTLAQDTARIVIVAIMSRPVRTHGKSCTYMYLCTMCGARLSWQNRQATGAGCVQ